MLNSKINVKINVIYLSFPSISPVFFSIGPIDVRWYSLAYMVGFIFAWRYIRYLSNSNVKYDKSSVNDKLIDDLVFYSILALIIGARIGYVIFYNFEYYSKKTKKTNQTPSKNI